jgi:hypothetical protein
MALPQPACDEALADLFVALGRSLLQYIDEADPWTDANHAGAKATLDRLAAAQRDSFTEIGDVLLAAHPLPELDAYPSEFASLHYLALDFLIGRIIADQLNIVATADAAITACGLNKAARLLERVRDREAAHYDELRRLADRLHEPTT